MVLVQVIFKQALPHPQPLLLAYFQEWIMLFICSAKYLVWGIYREIL